MKKAIFLALAIFTFSAADAQFGDLNKAANKAKAKVMGGENLSEEQVGQGLKEALDKGVGAAVDFLSAKDGYFASPYKILLPAEAENVVKKVGKLPGFTNLEADLTERMNRAAEDAAVKAKPIFVKAIKNMSFKDAMNLLMGDKDAATKYLEGNTSGALYTEFLPVIQESLDKVNARDLWKKSVTAYNKLPMVKETNPNLDDHVTKMALSGMFQLVAKKELDIRSNPSFRTSELLKKVFGKQDKK